MVEMELGLVLGLECLDQVLERAQNNNLHHKKYLELGLVLAFLWVQVLVAVLLG
jgi:hypothetical protein